MSKPASKGFYLRELSDRDWESVHAYASQEIVSRYQGWGPNSKKETRIYVSKILKEAKTIPRMQYVFAIVLKEEEEMVGAVELNIRDRTNRVGEIGYILHPDYWGQGIATNAAELILQFAFEEAALHRIFATCDPRNTGSRKVLEKAGMLYEGKLRENIRLRDGWRDSLVYGILEQEWRGQSHEKSAISKA